MEAGSALAYAAALAAVTAAPGPLVALIAARALRGDTGGALRFAAGVCLGDLVAIVLVAAGLGVWVQGQPHTLAALRLAGAGYVLWVAWEMWRDGSGAPRPVFARGPGASVAAGAALCLSNPATFVFYLALLPLAVPQGLTDPAVLAAVLALSVAVIGTILGGLVLLAVTAADLTSGPCRQTAAQRGMAGVLVAVAVWLIVA
jgi:threonine/homoserine/homoserine lactone efflux protein